MCVPSCPHSFKFFFQNVLKTDKENYNALVFFGVCATELNHYDQAKKAYEKAIEKNKDDILAWQVCRSRSL